MNHLGIDLHKHESQVAVSDDNGEVLDDIAPLVRGGTNNDRSNRQLLYDL